MLALSRPSRRARVAAGAALVAALVAATLTPTWVAPLQSASAASISGVVNSYQKVALVSGTAVTVTGSVTGAGTPFAVGDHVVLIQMTGTAPATGSNFGTYHRTTITAISGSTITLASVEGTYSPSSEAVQLVRVSYATGTTTLDDTVKPKPWDGITGGVVALAGGTLQLTNNIDATGTGFTNTNPPTSATQSSSTGAGSSAGRGSNGGVGAGTDGVAGVGGGGTGGGGGAAATGGATTGGGPGGGGTNGKRVGDPSVLAPGTDGGDAVKFPNEVPGQQVGEFGGGTGAGGGGGVIGGGGGGGSSFGSGGGGGVTGGGSGGAGGASPTSGLYAGAGGGGVGGVGNGGDGVPGGPNRFPLTSTDEGSGGAGGGSYGGGGGGASTWRGGDDSSGGGGGGSWFGGGKGGVGGPNSPLGHPYPAGGDGNLAVGSPIPDVAHFLNETDARLMMGGAGGRGSADSGSIPGGAGGGVVIVDFETIVGPGAIRSDGANGVSPASYGGGAHSGSGAGAGGQMLIEAGSITSPTVVSVKGGTGGSPSANTYHAGVPGGGGGAGGVWLRVEGATATCPSTGFPNVSFDLDGGSSGTPIINPKNGYTIGTAGDGATGLACVSDAPSSEPKLTLQKALDGSRFASSDQFRMVVHEDSITGSVVGTTTNDTTTGSGSTVTSGSGRVVVDPAVTGQKYVVTEVAAGSPAADLSNYSKTIWCVDANGVTSGNGVTSAAVSFDPAVGHEITPAAGADITCTISNKALTATLSLQKTLASDRLVTSDQYLLEVYEGSVAAGNLKGSQTTSGSGSTISSSPVVVNPAKPGTTYVLKESGAGSPAADLAEYAKTIWCQDTSGTMAAGTGGVTAAAVPYPAAGYSVTPAAGATISCVISNRALISKLEFTKTLVSATKSATALEYTVVYDLAAINSGDKTELYDLTDTLLPGAGAIFESGSWSGPSGSGLSGTFAASDVGVEKLLVDDRSIASGVTETFRVTVVYRIDPDAVTMVGSKPSNECQTGDPDGRWGFHNKGTLTWKSGKIVDDPCDEFPLEHKTEFSKVLGSSTKGVDGRYTVIYRIVVKNTGDFTETYNLADTLRPGAGAVFQSGSWVWDQNTSVSGAFTGPFVSTVFATARPIPSQGEHSYTVTAVYAIDPAAVTGEGPTASNECLPDDVDYSGNWAFHNTATYTWTGRPPIDDDACARFPIEFHFVKVLDGQRWQPGDQFTLEVHEDTLTGPLAGSSTTTGSGAVIDPLTGRITVSPAVSGKTYVLTEKFANGANPADYEATIACVDLNGVMTVGTRGITGTVAQPGPVPFDPSVGHAITPTAGSDISCTMTNRTLTTGVTFHKDYISSSRDGDNKVTVTYEITVTNTGERIEKYSLSDELKPGAGVTFIKGTWTGPDYEPGDDDGNGSTSSPTPRPTPSGDPTDPSQDTGVFEKIDTPVVLATDRTLGIGKVHTYEIEVLYQMVPSQIIGSGPTASNTCLPDNQHYEQNYALHNVSILDWRDTQTTDDACGPFQPPLALTGSQLNLGLAVPSALLVLLGGFGLVMAARIRGRRRATSTPEGS